MEARKKHGTEQNTLKSDTQNLPSSVASREARQLCRYISVSRKSQSIWVYPFNFHVRNISKQTFKAFRDLQSALQCLKIQLFELTHVPTNDLTANVCKSFTESLEPLLECVLRASENTECETIAMDCIHGIFKVSMHLPEEDKVINAFFVLFIERAFNPDKNHLISDAVCRNLPYIFSSDALPLVHNTGIFVPAFTEILTAILRLERKDAFCNLLEVLDCKIVAPILEGFKHNKPELYKMARLCAGDLMYQTEEQSPRSNIGINSSDATDSSEDEAEVGLLWEDFSQDYSAASFILSEALFESINDIAEGNLLGKTAHKFALEACKRIEEHFEDAVYVVMRDDVHSVNLVRTSQLTVICAVLQLFVMDSNFNLSLIGLQTFSKLIEAILEAKPQAVSENDFIHMQDR